MKHETKSALKTTGILLLVLLGMLLLVVLQSKGQQQGTLVDSNSFPNRTSPSQLFYYDGSNNLTYVCMAGPLQPSFSWTRSATTLTSIVDSGSTSTVTTSTAHGLQVGNQITISGATVATALNGSYVIQTVGATTSFTITTSGVGDGTFTESTLAVATTAPRSNALIWTILKMSYNGSNLLTNVQWAQGNSGTYTKSCDSRTTYDYR